ncbi:MAG TPA: DUF1931 family protein [Actinomycetes bacterium]
MSVMGVAKFERFFRAAASLDVDKDDLRRHNDFVGQKVYDLLLIGQAAARFNLRDVIEVWDLPVTKGLQESMDRFEELDEAVELQPILDAVAARGPLDLALGVDTEARLPTVAGGVSVALAQALKLIDPRSKNPSSQHWERALQLFDLLL